MIIKIKQKMSLSCKYEQEDNSKMAFFIFQSLAMFPIKKGSWTLCHFAWLLNRAAQSGKINFPICKYQEEREGGVRCASILLIPGLL